MSDFDTSYRLIDHTADFGIHVWGDHPAALFENAAMATVNQVSDLKRIETTESISVSVDGVDWPDLMVNWLREILYLFNGRDLLAGRVAVDRICATHLDATLDIAPFDPQRHTIRQEIKAVTYHQIQVSRGSEGWEARVIFDV